MAKKIPRQSNPEESKPKGSKKSPSVKAPSVNVDSTNKAGSKTGGAKKTNQKSEEKSPRKKVEAGEGGDAVKTPASKKAKLVPSEGGKQIKKVERASDAKVKSGRKKDSAAEDTGLTKSKSTTKKSTSGKSAKAGKAEKPSRKSVAKDPVLKGKKASDAKANASGEKGDSALAPTSKKSKSAADKSEEVATNQKKSPKAPEAEVGSKKEKKPAGKKSNKGDDSQVLALSEKEAPKEKKRGRKSAKSTVVESLVPKRRLARKRPPLLGSSSPGGAQSFASGEVRTSEAVAPAKKLSASFLKLQRNRLIDLRDSLIDKVSKVTRDSLGRGDDSEAASAFGQHQADAGSDAYDRDFALNILSKNKDTFYEIEAAIKRIDSGEYGICQYSGEMIPQARLEAVPFARYTVEHQERIEREEAMGVSRHSMTSIFGAEEKETIKTSDEEDEED